MMSLQVPCGHSAAQLFQTETVQEIGANYDSHRLGVGACHYVSASNRLVSHDVDTFMKQRFADLCLMLSEN